MDALTPTLNQQQLQENITALQKGGVGNDVVQKYVDNYKLDSPGSYSLKTAAPAAMSPFNPKAPNSQAVQTKTPATAPGTGAFFLGSLGTGVKQTASNLTAPIVGGAKEVATDTSEAFKSGIDQVKQGAGDINNGKGNPLDLVRGVGRMGSGVVGAAFSPLAAPMKPISLGTQAYTDAVAGKGTDMGASATTGKIFTSGKSTPQKSYEDPVAKFANTTFGKNVAGAAENVANYSNIAGAVGGFMGGPKLAETGAAKLDTAVAPVKAGAIETAGKVSDAASAVKTAAEEHYVQSAAKQWEKPSTMPGTKFSKAADIYSSATEKGHNIGETLARNNLNPADHIESGVYTTAETADKIRTDTGKLSSQLLRPSLEKADAYTPKTPVSDVIKSSIDNIKNNKGLTQETKDLLTKKLNQTASSLQKQYPEGMKLVDLHDEKITRDANAKYSPVGDIGTNNEAIKNKAVADAARITLEAKAPPEVPVHDFNAELTKQYKAASYLDALNGKKAPVSKLSKLANYGGKVAGLAVGHSVGGGILSDVVGYHLGGMVERMFEGMSNPLKSHFLENLKTTNPEAFTKISEYLKSPNLSPEEIAKINTPANPNELVSAGGKGGGTTELPKGMGKYDIAKNRNTTMGTKLPPGTKLFSEFEKNFTPEQINQANRLIDALQNQGKTIDMKAINGVVKKITPVQDVKPSITTMNKAKGNVRVKSGAFSPKAK